MDESSNTGQSAQRPITSDTGPFAIVPEWLLDAPVSDRAVRLYALLARYCDGDGYAWPSRKTLATRLGRSVDALDRAVKELVQCGALTVEPRFTGSGDRTSNGYVLRRVQTAPTQGGSRESAATPTRSCAATGGRNPAALTRAIENESQLERKAPAAADAMASDRDVVWDSLLAVCGVDPLAITKSSRGAYNRAVKDLRELGATERDIVIRATVFRRRWPDASLTPTALARRWPECDPDRQHGNARPLLPDEYEQFSRLTEAWENR